MENSKQPIHPQMYTRFGDGEDDFEPLKDGNRTGWEMKMGGLTKREYFAGQAMVGMLLNSHNNSSKFIAEISVKCAYELLKQLEESK